MLSKFLCLAALWNWALYNTKVSIKRICRVQNIIKTYRNLLQQLLNAAIWKMWIFSSIWNSKSSLASTLIVFPSPWSKHLAWMPAINKLCRPNPNFTCTLAGLLVTEAFIKAFVQAANESQINFDWKGFTD